MSLVGSVKNFVKALDKVGDAFKYPKLSLKNKYLLDQKF